MTPKIMLRIASLLMLVHLLGHTVGQLGWKDTTDPVKQEVIDQMTKNRFPFMGAVKSFGDYYEGYGWICWIALALAAWIQWISSGAMEENRKLLRQLLLPLGIGLLIWSGLELAYFFPFAASMTFLSGALTLTAALRANAQKGS